MNIRIPSPYCPDCSFSGLRIGTRADEQFSVVAVLALLVCNTVFGAWRTAFGVEDLTLFQVGACDSSSEDEAVMISPNLRASDVAISTEKRGYSLL